LARDKRHLLLLFHADKGSSIHCPDPTKCPFERI
jgi:hypothetical protein